MNREGTLLITREVRWGWVLWRTTTLLGLALAACTTRDATPSRPADSADKATAACVDRDQDGFGAHCKQGSDCNDRDPSLHDRCAHCATPAEGCACDAGSLPVACYLDKTTNDAGTIMCHEGTRSCREGFWSGCESIRDYPLPERSGATALVGSDAGPTPCNDCNVNCFSVTDELNRVDGGLDSDNSTNVDWVPGGGLTLGVMPQADAGVVDSGTVEIPPCTVGVGEDLDCDGIPNTFDPYPNDPPFATANPTIFLNIPPGQTGVGAIDLTFKVTSADVYFLVDQSGSMDQERDQLKASLTSGDFINDEDYDCADADFNHVPDNDNKQKGIIGAIRCYIRDANFGVGFFREIPFTGYAASDHVAFANLHDISSEVNSVLAAVSRLTTVGNSDWPEASMLALHQVLTGNGMYFGTQKRGIPSRSCPSLTWGYPCFRTGAIPIVVLFTDAQFHNGPISAGGSFNYGSGLSITAGTGSQYYPLAATNDTFATAIDLGDVTNSYKTYTGTTENLTADIAPTYFPCEGETDGKDALFKFSLSQAKTVKIESTGSQFDTLLGLYTGVPAAASALPAYSNTNEVGASAVAMGQVANSAWKATGSTSGMSADYQWTEVGCGAATNSPDAVFKFDVSATTAVSIDTIGSSFDTVIGLYNAPPRVAPSFTAIANGNEDHTSAYDVGDLYTGFKAYSGSTSGMVSDYITSQIGCSADSNAPDATYQFTLSSAHRVRISTEGSGFDTVLGLFSGSANPVVNLSVPNTNEGYDTAYDVGTVDNRIFKLTGSTSGMDANYFASQVNCNANTGSPDAVYRFRLNSARSVQVDTIGTSWDSVLALYSQAPDATTQVSTSNNNESFTSAQNLGVVNSKDIIVNGGSTTSMASDFTTTANPCTQSSGGQTARDAAYRFKLNSSTTLKIDTTGSGFDSTIAVHALPPTEASAAVSNTNDTVATAIDVGSIDDTSFQRTGDTSALAHNYNFTGAHTSARDAVFRFTLASTTNVQIDTAGTPFDTVLGLFGSFIPQPATSSSTTAGITSNGAAVNAYDPGGGVPATMDDRWRVLSGDTSSAGNEWTDNRCSTVSSSPDVYYKFTLATPRTIALGISSTFSSGSARAILYKGSLAAGSYNSCVSGNSSSNLALTAGTYYVVVKGNSSSAKGAYSLTVRDITSTTPIASNDDVTAGSNTTSLITVTSLPAGTYHVVVSAAENVFGAYTVRFRDKSYWDGFSYLTCNNGSNNAATIEQTFGPGDYGIIIKGRTRFDSGAYSLRVTDTLSPPLAAGVLACDDDSGGGTAARIFQAALPAGDYWVVLKGDADSSAGSYTINLRDTSASASGALLQCDDDSGDSPTSVIERDLTAGTYQVVLKGKTAAASGAYKLSLRDVTTTPVSRLSCDNDGGGNLTSRLSTTLTPGSYYVALKGKTPSASGAYTLSVRDSYNVPTTTAYCDDDGSTYNTSRIQTTTLNAGTYYVALKGANASNSGPYQLSIGAGTTTAATYTPPSWATTLSTIKAKNTRVISILSCHDDPVYGNVAGDCNEVRTQANTLAAESKALGPTNNKLVFDIDRDGTGLSSTVVSAISQLANYLEMNVLVNVLYEPDANPGFITNVRAIDEATDGCSGLVGIEHQHCLPGASPRFLLEFLNPPSAPVPVNPDDTKGGYTFKAQLIGNSQFVVDEIPIYIIPEAVPPPPVPPDVYYPTGEYHQDITASTCSTSTQAPDWNDLSWNATVYGNTSVSFGICAANEAADLDGCTAREVVHISGTTDCNSNSDCQVGFCDTSIDVCQVARGSDCSSNLECPDNATCDMNELRCIYHSQPVYMGDALGADNRKPYLRMSIVLTATDPFIAPPVVNSWSANYLCRGTL